jgi:hypothetical protein
MPISTVSETYFFNASSCMDKDEYLVERHAYPIFNKDQSILLTEK